MPPICSTLAFDKYLNSFSGHDAEVRQRKSRLEAGDLCRRTHSWQPLSARKVAHLDVHLLGHRRMAKLVTISNICLALLFDSEEHDDSKTSWGMAYLARVVLRTFFPEAGDSMQTGILISDEDVPILVKVKFAGWLADLKGHKEITEWKGTGGNLCCLGCANLNQSVKGSQHDGRIGLDCFDSGKFKRRSNADVHKIVDDLSEHASNKRMSKARFNKMHCQSRGKK